MNLQISTITVSLFFVLFAFAIDTAQCQITPNEHIVKHRAEALEFQKNLTDTYADKEKSILSEDDRKKFVALGGHPFFPYDDNLRVTADLIVYPDPDKVEMKTSTTRIANYNIYGKASFNLYGQDYELFLYQNAQAFANKLYKDLLFLPFTDLTSGVESYGGGRYIDVKIPDDKTKIVIDFNKSYQPYCAYTDGYSCPIPPIENFIDCKIKAGIQHLDIKHTLSSTQLLDKSISYHDPKSNWSKLKAEFKFTTIMDDKSERIRSVSINNKKEEFNFIGQYEEGRLEYKVKKNMGKAMWNGSTSIPKDMAEKYRISDDRAIMYRNYYTYLYGMPMKLKDPGTNIDDKVTRVEFYGKTYDRIRVTYDPNIGKDIWYFYFNTDTHALEAYQFFKDETKNDGEYILFEKTKIVDGIKIPSVRHWYYNNNQKFLATDILN
jgi:uncharacterized protein (DUF1684 family)